jgi:hypothetical protein
MINDLITTIAHAFRRFLLPLAAYYAVTVAIPLANGASQTGATFWQHLLAVLVVPPAIVVLVSIVCQVARRRRTGGAPTSSRF